MLTIASAKESVRPLVELAPAVSEAWLALDGGRILQDLARRAQRCPATWPLAVSPGTTRPGWQVLVVGLLIPLAGLHAGQPEEP